MVIQLSQRSQRVRHCTKNFLKNQQNKTKKTNRNSPPSELSSEHRAFPLTRLVEKTTWCLVFVVRCSMRWRRTSWPIFTFPTIKSAGKNRKQDLNECSPLLVVVVVAVGASKHSVLMVLGQFNHLSKEYQEHQDSPATLFILHKWQRRGGDQDSIPFSCPTKHALCCVVL